MDTYIYLHGFNSSGASAKGRYFRQALAPATVHTPSYPPDPDAAVSLLQAILDSQLAQHISPCLIGSSLGGYYAQYLARVYRLPAILINPALRPRETLAPFLGWQTNYHSAERYYFGPAQLARLERFAIQQPCSDPVPTLVLLDAGDELIDYQDALDIYSACAELRVYPDGDHGFQHLAEASTAIREFVSKM